MPEYERQKVHQVIIKYNETFLLDDLYNTTGNVIFLNKSFECTCECTLNKSSLT